MLVNNAGITRDTLIMRMSSEDWDMVVDTNLKGAFNFSRAVLRAMVKQRKGRIVNIGSVSGLIGLAGQANYSASKAGLVGLTKTLARELASRNITANLVAPGFVETDMTSVLTKMSERLLSRKSLWLDLGPRRISPPWSCFSRVLRPPTSRVRCSPSTVE